jgi:bifunctional DNA-binding transcriptional regulator/antitoxin component of YhaV-PrlF toxin-antitoxin module
MMEDTRSHARLRIGAQGRVVLPAELRAVLGFVEGSAVVAHIEGEGRLVIESPEAIQRALLQEWSEVAGEVSLVDELRAERRAAAAREAEQLQADRAEQVRDNSAEQLQADRGEQARADRAGERA